MHICISTGICVMASICRTRSEQPEWIGMYQNLGQGGMKSFLFWFAYPSTLAQIPHKEVNLPKKERNGWSNCM